MTGFVQRIAAVVLVILAASFGMAMDHTDDENKNKSWASWWGAKVKENAPSKEVLGGAAMGTFAGPAATTAAVSAAGFTGSGIAGGTMAAGAMSSAAVANGGGIAAGTAIAGLQTIGAVGLGVFGTVATAGVGAVVVGGSIYGYQRLSPNTGEPTNSKAGVAAQSTINDGTFVAATSYDGYKAVYDYFVPPEPKVEPKTPSGNEVIKSNM